MNYYIFYVSGEAAYDYLQKTNYVGVWEDDRFTAFIKVSNYFATDTTIRLVNKNDLGNVKIGYLH